MLQDAKRELERFDMAALRDRLATCDHATPERLDAAFDWLETIRRELIDVLDHVDDPADAAMAVAIQYVELKSRWIGLNTKMNYAMFRTGQCRVEDQLRAGAVTHLLTVLEPCIDPEDVNKIREFLAKPLDKAA